MASPRRCGLGQRSPVHLLGRGLCLMDTCPRLRQFRGVTVLHLSKLLFGALEPIPGDSNIIQGFSSSG
jgi:hypothetical protein